MKSYSKQSRFSRSMYIVLLCTTVRSRNKDEQIRYILCLTFYNIIQREPKHERIGYRQRSDWSASAGVCVITLCCHIIFTEKPCSFIIQLKYFIVSLHIILDGRNMCLQYIHYTYISISILYIYIYMGSVEDKTNEGRGQREERIPPYVAWDAGHAGRRVLNHQLPIVGSGHPTRKIHTSSSYIKYNIVYRFILSISDKN